MLDFSNAPEPTPGNIKLIPENTLIGGVIKLMPARGGSGLIHQSQSSSNTYINACIEVQTAPYRGSRIYDVLGVSGSDGFMNLSDIKIRAILETNGASPQNPSGYNISARTEIDGKRVACRVGVDVSGDKPKNIIHVYLSPFASTTKEEFERLTKGDVHPPDALPPLTPNNVGMRDAPNGALPPQPQSSVPGWLDGPERASGV